MAQLKDTTVSGLLNVTGGIYDNDVQIKAVKTMDVDCAAYGLSFVGGSNGGYYLEVTSIPELGIVPDNVLSMTIVNWNSNALPLMTAYINSNNVLSIASYTDLSGALTSLVVRIAYHE